MAMRFPMADSAVAGWLPVRPGPPDWRVDWPAILAANPWIESLAACPQDPRHHAEGDVAVHTRLVLEAMTADPAFQERSPEDRDVLFAAALLHDIGKPSVTRRDPDGAITSPGHSVRGAILARRILWRLSVPFAAREQIVALVRNHQRPFHLIDRADARRLAIETSQTARCDLLMILANSDARGRICLDQPRLLEQVALFEEFCRDLGCLSRQYPFASGHARFAYFRSPDRDPDYPAYDDSRGEAILLSGLPGAGKDHWIRHSGLDWPVVGLDDLREEMGIAPADPQGPVIRRAREIARGYLRAGTPFIWNGTNLSRRIRGQCIDLFADYRARVRIVYVEVPEERLRRQNRSRSRPVPESVLERLLDRWEVPDPTEGHQVDWVLSTESTEG